MATEPTSGPITGEGGSVSIDSVAVADVRNWQVTRNNDLKQYSSSSTGGYKKSKKGNFSATGKFDMFLDFGAQSLGFEVGDLVDFVGTTHTGKTFTSEIRIADIDVGVDIENAELEGASISFVVNGTWAVV